VFGSLSQELGFYAVSKENLGIPRRSTATIIKVPDELAHEIDRFAGAKKRSA
jgi:hypothetical protein